MQASLMRCFLFLRFFAVTGVCRFRWRNPEGVRLRSGEHLGTVGFDYVTKVGTRFTVRSKGDRPERRLLLMPFRREARLRRSDGALGNR